MRGLLPPQRTIELVQPFFFGSAQPSFEFLASELYAGRLMPWVNSVYIGLIPAAFALLALRTQFARAWPWLLVAGFALLLAFGRHVPVSEWLLLHTPLVSSQRFPEKFLYWVTLGLCVLAAIGADSALAGATTRIGQALGTRPLARLALGAAILVVGFWLLLDAPLRAWAWEYANLRSAYWTTRIGASVTHAGGLIVHMTIVMSTILVAVWLGVRQRRRCVALLLATLGMDRLAPANGIRHDIRYLNSRTLALAPKEQYFVLRKLLPVGGAAFLGDAGVKYVLTTIDPDNPLWRVDPFVEVFRAPALNMRVLEVPRPRARARLETAVTMAASRADARRTFARVLAARGQTTVLEGSAGPVATGTDAPRLDASVALHRPSPERVVLDLVSPHRRAYAVVRETHLPGWTATLDARPAPILAANLRWMAVAVDAGRHRLVLEYRTPRLVTGVVTSLLGLSLCGLLYWRGVASRRPTA